MCVNGLKLWQEEFTRVLEYHVEQECNQFLKKKVFLYYALLMDFCLFVDLVTSTDVFNFIIHDSKNLKHNLHSKSGVQMKDGEEEND